MPLDLSPFFSLILAKSMLEYRYDKEKTNNRTASKTSNS